MLNFTFTTLFVIAGLLLVSYSGQIACSYPIVSIIFEVIGLAVAGLSTISFFRLEF